MALTYILHKAKYYLHKVKYYLHTLYSNKPLTFWCIPTVIIYPIHQTVLFIGTPQMRSELQKLCAQNDGDDVFMQQYTPKVTPILLVNSLYPLRHSVDSTDAKMDA